MIQDIYKLIGIYKMTAKQDVNDAFEYYYSLGPERTYKKIAEKFGVSINTVKKWAQRYGWRKRKSDRDTLIQKRVEEELNEEIVKVRTKYRNVIKDAFETIGDDLNRIVEKLEAGNKLEWVKDIRDFERLVNCIERLIKLDLLLMGESTEKKELTTKENKTFIDWLMDADRKRGGIDGTNVSEG